MKRKNTLNDLQIFYNAHFGKLRSLVDEDGNLWFVAVDVCSALELNNVGQALSSLDDDEKSSIIINDGTPGSPVRATVSEPGLYSLVLRSRKPAAKTFKRWVTHEVIPTIRKTGQYKVPQPEKMDRQPSERAVILSYVVTLRQLARVKIYPPLARAAFLAEAASLLSGYPASRFMPPKSQCPLFQ